MKFKEFLVEYSKPVQNEIDLVYQHILDNLDDGHIDVSKEKLSFNIGKIIKDSSYNNLEFVIRKAQRANARLGKKGDSQFAIVVDTPDKIPSRESINNFLESTKYVSKIKAQFKKYLETHHDADADVEPATGYEKNKTANVGFEENYTKLIKAIEGKVSKFHDSKQFAKNKHNSTGNVGKQEVLQSAIAQLFTSEIGGNFDEFKRIVLKLPEAQFIKQIDPEGKKKLLSRLESYYEHKSEGFNPEDEDDGEDE